MNFFALIPLIFYLLLLGLHILLARAVHTDGAGLEEAGNTLCFVGPRAWAISALLFGIFGVLVYWLIHHSSLATKAEH